MSNKIDLLSLSEVKLSLIKDKKIIFKNFEDFNIYLVNYSIKITILDYIKCVHLYFFKEVDINLLNDFLNYCKDDQLFNISDEILIKYKLIKDNTEDTLETFIKINNLKLDKDYRIRKINNINKETKSKSINKDYKFTSRILKQCLLKNDINYIDYYLLLENCILHYTNYQTNLYNKLGFIKDIKLDNLIKNYEYQSEKINLVYSDIENLNNQNKMLNNNINFTYKKVMDVMYQLNLQEEEKNKVNSKFVKVINTFALYKLNSNKIIYIDCNSKLFSNVEKMTKLEFVTDLECIYKIEYNIKYLNIMSKILFKFPEDIDINRNTILLCNNLSYNHIINYIDEELAKFN